MPTTCSVGIFAFCWIHYVGQEIRVIGEGKLSINMAGVKTARICSEIGKERSRRGENRIAFSVIVPTALIGREKCAFTAPTPKLKR